MVLSYFSCLIIILSPFSINSTACIEALWYFAGEFVEKLELASLLFETYKEARKLPTITSMPIFQNVKTTSVLESRSFEKNVVWLRSWPELFLQQEAKMSFWALKIEALIGSFLLLAQREIVEMLMVKRWVLFWAALIQKLELVALSKLAVLIKQVSFFLTQCFLLINNMTIF